MIDDVSCKPLRWIFFGGCALLLQEECEQQRDVVKSMGRVVGNWVGRWWEWQQIGCYANKWGPEVGCQHQ